MYLKKNQNLKPEKGQQNNEFFLSKANKFVPIYA